MRRSMTSPALPGNQQGFTLVEAVLVITITAILSAIVALFLRVPMQGYLDASRRAELTDTADSAARRISRDLRLALPNSVRIDASGFFLEFLPLAGSGRYRATGDGGTDILDFTTAADNSFDVLGPAISIGAGSSIVVFNLGIAGADAYEGSNRRLYNGVVGAASANIAYQAVSGSPFPFESPGNRFHVITTPVSYVCDQASRTLWRYWNYPIQAAQPGSLAILDGLGGQRARMATNVACTPTLITDMGTRFEYAAGVMQRSGLVSIRLQLQDDSGESVNLYHEVHVSNVP